MKKVILLCTAWAPDYWESPKEAPYPKRKYTDLSDWETLSKNCPLPGIGIYIKQKNKDFRENPFVYLKITGMRYDENDKSPCFNFEPIKESSIESKILMEKLPPENQKLLFSAIDVFQLDKILNEIGEKPPEEWSKLIKLVIEPAEWYDYIGEYFLELKSGTLNDDEFEDRIADLLTALGFEVTQKGHKLRGEYPDGIAIFDNYGIVYDCKNTAEFTPTKDDIRALEKYLNDEKKVYEDYSLYPAFIAKSFKEHLKPIIFYFSVEDLLYLLYKKLKMGFKFNLSPFKKILSNNMSLNTKTIDNEWLK